jgi:hypothetical protein
MDELLNEDDFNHWFSTYGVITSQRILSHYKIKLPDKELLPAIKNPKSFYHKLIQVPLKNVLNGIILQQANDYHIYVQKLFIDYLLSGESGKPPEAQGALTRENLEEERKNVVSLGEHFNQSQIDHETMISTSQKVLIKITKNLSHFFETGISSLVKLLSSQNIQVKNSQVKDSVVHALIFYGLQEDFKAHEFISKMNELLKINLNQDLESKLEKLLTPLFQLINEVDIEISEYIEKVAKINTEARSYRSQFYDYVLRVIELIKLLPEYKINPEQDAINRESLYFDKNIGEAG